MPRFETYNFDGSRMRCPACNSLQVGSHMDRLEKGTSGGLKSSVSLVNVSSSRNGNYSYVAQRHTYTPVTHTADAMQSMVPKRAQIETLQTARIWICAIALIISFFSLITALKGGSWTLMILSTIIGFGTFYGGEHLIDKIAREDPTYKAEVKLWLRQLRCSRCNQVFLDPNWANPDSTDPETQAFQAMFEEQHLKIPQWRREKASYWTGPKPKPGALEWCGKMGDGSREHRLAWQNGQDITYPS